jgi:hypothetical protein
LSHYHSYSLHYELESCALGAIDADYNIDARIRHDLQFDMADAFYFSVILSLF